MSNDLLSQEEVESLLKGVDEAAVEPATETPQDAGPVRAWRFGAAAQGPRNDPALAALNERFAMLMRARLLALVRRSPQVAVPAPRAMPYGELVRNVSLPEAAVPMSLAPLRGEGVIVFEPGLVSAVVDALFGGGGRVPRDSETRAFSRAELHVLHRLLPITLDACRSAWEPVHALELKPLALPRSTQPDMLLPSDEIVLVLSLQIELGAVGGALHFALPQSSLDPIKPLLAGGPRRVPALPDRRASEILHAQVQTLDVDVVARFASVSLTLRKLIEMQVGDVLSMDLPTSITAVVGETPLLDCTYGMRNGRYAMRVERVRTPERSLGVLHG
jgi:flagellar motor switch protein FliM